MTRDFGLVAYVHGDDTAYTAMAQRLEAVGVEVRRERRYGQRRARTSGRGDSVERRKPPVLRGSFVLQVKSVFLWWFLAISAYGGVQTVGPFTTQKECEEVRAEVKRWRTGMSITTRHCWWSETRG